MCACGLFWWWFWGIWDVSGSWFYRGLRFICTYFESTGGGGLSVGRKGSVGFGVSDLVVDKINTLMRV